MSKATLRELIAVLQTLLEALATQESPPPRLTPARTPAPVTITQAALEDGFVPYVGAYYRGTLPTSWVTRRFP
jgi:hypothetical protein